MAVFDYSLLLSLHLLLKKQEEASRNTKHGGNGLVCITVMMISFTSIKNTLLTPNTLIGPIHPRIPSKIEVECPHPSPRLEYPKLRPGLNSKTHQN